MSYAERARAETDDLLAEAAAYRLMWRSTYSRNLATAAARFAALALECERELVANALARLGLGGKIYFTTRRWLRHLSSVRRHGSSSSGSTCPARCPVG